MEARKRVTDTIAIKKIMVEKGYKTINSLATASGINRTTLGKVLDGKIQPSSDVMFKLVETLDISAPDAGNIFFAADLRTA
jgi:transcriptional regulator with XRE-family HTH domain